MKDTDRTAAAPAAAHAAATITEAELQAAFDKIDALKKQHSAPRYFFTDAQYRIIIHARTGSPRLSWPLLHKFFADNYGYAQPEATFKRQAREDIVRRGDTSVLRRIKPLDIGGVL